MTTHMRTKKMIKKMVKNIDIFKKRYEKITIICITPEIKRMLKEMRRF